MHTQLVFNHDKIYCKKTRLIFFLIHSIEHSILSKVKQIHQKGNLFNDSKCEINTLHWNGMALRLLHNDTFFSFCKSI